jgi:small subunit ribosomal protein S29
VVPEEILISKHEGFIDQPRQGKLFLERFKIQNTELLKKLELKTTQKYEWSQREATEVGSPLMDIVDHGLLRVRHSCDCVEALANELKIQATAGKCKVLVAAEGINAIFHRTIHRRENKDPIEGHELSMVRAIKEMLKYDWKNGAVVVTVDRMAAPDFHRESDLPRYLLTDKGFELFDPFIPIKTENYTDKEIYSHLEYFIDRRWIQHERANSPQGKLELVHLSGKNPGSFTSFASFW